MGNTDRIRQDHYRYFVRTSKTGDPIGDTSNLKGHPDDFSYAFDETCKGGDNPRKLNYILRVDKVHINK